jgi:hypothetical protein
MFTVTFEADFKNLKGQFAKANAALFESKKKEVRTLGERWVQIAKEEAPVGKTDPKHPDNRRGNVKFRDSFQFETFIDGQTEGFRGTSQQPLGKWIVYGTKRHDIPLSHFTKSLSFFWTKIGMEVIVPKKGGKHQVKNDILYIGKGFVDHPGTKPNPYTERAARRLDTDEKTALQRVANQWVISFGG